MGITRRSTAETGALLRRVGTFAGSEQKAAAARVFKSAADGLANMKDIIASMSPSAMAASLEA